MKTAISYRAGQPTISLSLSVRLAGSPTASAPAAKNLIFLGFFRHQHPSSASLQTDMEFLYQEGDLVSPHLLVLNPDGIPA